MLLSVANRLLNIAPIPKSMGRCRKGYVKLADDGSYVADVSMSVAEELLNSGTSLESIRRS